MAKTPRSKAPGASAPPSQLTKYHGPDATSVDANRPWKDPLAIVDIMAPHHSLHDQCDPKRYELSNPKFAALVRAVSRRGPMMITLRRNGTLPKDSPQYKYLQRAYSDKVRDDEPQLETVYGNSRLRALIIVNAEREAQGLEPYRQKYEYVSIDDTEAKEIHAEENLIRQGNSMWNNLLIVRSHIKGGGDWAKLAEAKFGLPEAEVRRMYEPLLECERCLVDAFADGRITLAVAKKIAGKYGRAAHAAKLAEYLSKAGDFAPKPRAAREDRPTRVLVKPAQRTSLIRLLERHLERSREPELAALLESLRA